MDWISLFEENRIEYVTRGPNTKRGEVSIKCPFCGEDDPSQHMGVNPKTDMWGCHRNITHRGKSTTWLIQALLGVSKAQAALIVRQYDQADPDTLEQALLALGAAPEAPESLEKITLPPDFQLITHWGTGRKYWQYLQRRGFKDPEQLAKRYELMYCTTGRWKDRIIFPIYQRGELVAWTARALVNPHTAPRYLSTSNAIKKTIFNEDTIMCGGDALFITEGPFDALKIDYYGRWNRARATCVFGTSVTMDQIYTLRQVSALYRRVVLMLDPDAVEQQFNLSEWLPKAEQVRLPDGVEDPGALTKTQVFELTAPAP